MRDYFGGVGAAESLGFSVSDAALIIKDILLHYPCVSFIASKKILDNSSVQAAFWKAAVADGDRKSTRLNSSHNNQSRMPSSA